MMDFPCNICNKVLKRKDTLNGHIRRFHPANEQEKIKCATCNKIFSRISDMKKHAAKFHFYEAKDKLPKTNDVETSTDFINCPDTETNALPAYEEMQNEEINFKTTTESLKNKISEDQQKFLVRDFINGLKVEYDIDILEIANAQKRHTGYIQTNAQNIMQLLNCQNYQNSQIKNIGEFLSQNVTNESNKKVFNCLLCNKNYSTKASLYSHKNRYHKERVKEKRLKCQKCNDLFESEADLAIHGFRYHRATL